MTESIDQLVKSFHEDTLPQTILIRGPHGAGQNQYMQKVLDKLIPSQRGTSDLFCITRPTDKSTISLAQVREARDFLSHSPLQLPYKILVFYQSDFIATEGQNALLKIMEEPSSNSYIFLISSYSLLLPTILSRCYPIDIQPEGWEKWGRVDLKVDWAEETKRYLYAISGSLQDKSVYIEEIFQKESFDYLEDLLVIWESIHVLHTLAQTNQGRYTWYMQNYHSPLRQQIVSVHRRWSFRYNAHLLSFLLNMKQSLLVSNRKKQSVLEAFIFAT